LSLFVLAVYLLYRSRKETAYSWGFRLISFGILYFFIAVSVESSLIPIKDVIFEHRVYLPSFGFFLCFTVCIFLIKNRLREPLNRAVIPALVLVIIILAGAAYARNTIWSSSLALWEDAVKKSPMKARPHINLGKALFDRGDTDAAIKEYLSAINLDPNYDAAYSNLGACYESLGRLDEAIPQLLTAIRLNPYEPKPYMTLGLIYGRQGLFEQAIEEFRMVIKNSPNSAEAHHNLGVALYKNGLLKEAYAEVLFSIKLNPELSGAAHRNLAVIKGKLDSVR
jgi:tetratricopeptide (TPR) repeat protein